jgi:acyl-CoA synthetase (AMP-forming)/AMP-acid ligase II
MSLLNAACGDERVAVIDAADGAHLTYGALREVTRSASKESGVSFLIARNRAAIVQALFHEWASGRAVGLLNPDLPSASQQALIDLYRPHRLIGFRADLESLAGPYRSDGAMFGDVAVMRRNTPNAPNVHPDLFLLLATSGTTGGAKFVRLSQANLKANANDIALALGITSNDVALAHLPLHYSFGLSVITSHLSSGAKVVLSEVGLISAKLWEACRRYGCTSLSAVPAHMDMLQKLTLRRLKVDTLTTVCQAGGRADRTTLEAIHLELSQRAGGRLFVMYGQTEASPRMTTLPADKFQEKPGSVGCALPSGRLRIEGEDGALCAPGETGQVVYHGANVMMGYAATAEDFALGDVTGGRLVTGDLGYLDTEGYLFLTGRVARFAKVAGLRIALDEVERIGGELAFCAAIDAGDRVIVVTATPASGKDELAKALLQKLYDATSAPLRSFDVRFVDELPRKSNGKLDYKALKEALVP